MTPRHYYRLVVYALFVLPSSLGAQLPVPVLHSVFPPGAQAGTTVEVTIRGTFLEGASALRFSDESLGIPSEAIADESTPDYTTRFRLTVPSEAKPGTYDLFAKCALGLSSPRPFVIGTKEELLESTHNSSRERAMLLVPETVVNGRADENANDYYRVEAKAGEKLVISCRAEDLDSRMDATLVLTDSTGRELDRDRNNRNRDSVVALTAPQDGSYFLHVADFTYGGGHRYPYRLSMTAAPHLEFVFPPAGQPGTPVVFTLYGRNLPGSDPTKRILVGNRLLEMQEVEINLPAEGATTRSYGAVRPAFLPHIPYHLAAGSLKSNSLPIGIASAPVVIEREDSGEAGQEISIPGEVHGHFARARDKDRFRFTAKKDEELWIEVIAERLGASADPSLRIERVTKSDDGVEQFQQISAADDLGNDPGERLFPLPCRDAELSLKIPEDGVYRITVMNQTGSGGLDQIYRLVVREPRPDFDLVALPWEQFRVRNQVDVLTPILRPGGSTELRILALRNEGFGGEIELTVEGLPPGVTCSPVKMGGGRSATIALTAAPNAARWDGLIKVRATSGDLTREARLGTVPWAVNDWSKQYFETRLGPSVPLSVTDAEKAPVTVLAPESRAFEIAIGDKLELPIRLLRKIPNNGEFVLRADGLPHKTAELKMSADTDKGTLVIASGKPDEFPREPGTWTFRMRAEGTINYQPSEATAVHARALHQRLVERKREHSDQLVKLKEARDQTAQQLDELEGAIEPVGSEKEKTSRSHLIAADEHLQAARETAAGFQAAVLRAAADAKSANELVKPRDVRIVIYSEPITITVKRAE